MAALQEAAFTGLNGGLNLALPAYELQDNECRYLQDALLDYQGLIRRRGPVTPLVGMPTFTEKGQGLMGTLNPAGAYRLAVLTGTNSSGFFKMFSDNYSSLTSFDWPFYVFAEPASNPYRLVDIKPVLNGGVGFGVSSSYGRIPAPDTTNNQTFAFWMGANKPTYSTGTVALTRGSPTVTGSGTLWAANAVPGHFLFVTIETGSLTGGVFKAFVGVVKSVNSDTSITLTGPSPYGTAAGAAYDLQPVRGFNYKVAKGRITTTTASTTVTGATTKFISQYMDEVLSTQNGTTTSGSPIITGLTSTSGMLRGMRVQGTNIPAGSIIVTIDSGTQITINNNASGSGTVSLSFKYGWNLYRASDMTWIGRVSTVNNEISITLAANATVALNNERFVALKSAFGQYTSTSPDLGTLGNLSSFSTISRHKVGFLTANYAGRQWYANNGSELETLSRVWFSETNDPEAVDISSFDGDYINAYSSVETDTPIKALVPAYNGLVVIKENEAFAITGSSPSTFSLKKIYDDGTLSGMSAAAYAGGVIWAGREGILYYDGIQTQNITQAKLGDYYKNALRLFDPNTYRMWATVVREHYFLFIENYDPSVAVIKGSKSQTPTAITLVINMVTGAMNFWTNIAFRGAVETPADTGKKTLFVLNDTSKANIVDASELFDTSGRDAFLCDGTGYFREDVGITTAFNTSLQNILASANNKSFSQITPPSNGAIESISVRMWVQTDGTATKLKAGVYSDSSGSPNALLGTSAEVTLDGVDDDQGTWRQFNFTTPIAVSADTPVWIGVIQDTGTCVIRYGTTGTLSAGIKRAADTYSDGFENPFGTIDSTANGQLVAYATIRSAGPDFYLESKKYHMGNPMIKKLFKQLALTYMVQGDSLKLDTVLGNQSIGRTARSEFPQTVYTWQQLGLLFNTWDDLSNQFPTWDSLVNANFRPRRIKFLKRSQMLSFRLYQKSQAVTQLQIGPFQLAYKWQRIGKI